ncbi:GW dipeptide domain-containing protein [uncultured Vagococcus sp.]|uniref:GW dipeptide domain-containing protein n=1 Tax=uncultured Vagococcus sp. TaxID=189676 RepID=UPI0028D49B69|nr:GW dipeptide domain-containing protein [uncultured Vagococcus sp.]
MFNIGQSIFNVPQGAPRSKVTGNIKDYQNKEPMVTKEIETQFTNGSKGPWVEISVDGKVLGIIDKKVMVDF